MSESTLDQVLRDEGVIDAPAYVVGEQPRVPSQFVRGGQLAPHAWSSTHQPESRGPRDRYPVTAALRTALTRDKASRMIDQAIEDAIEGAPRTRAVAREFIRDTLEGKPKVRMEIEAVPFEASGYGQAMQGLREELQAAGLLPASTSTLTQTAGAPIDNVDA